MPRHTTRVFSSLTFSILRFRFCMRNLPQGPTAGTDSRPFPYCRTSPEKDKLDSISEVCRSWVYVAQTAEASWIILHKPPRSKGASATLPYHSLTGSAVVAAISTLHARCGIAQLT